MGVQARSSHLHRGALVWFSFREQQRTSPEGARRSMRLWGRVSVWLETLPALAVLILDFESPRDAHRRARGVRRQG
jgi:hypothetical protein